MCSRVAIRVLGAGLGVLFLVGSARAGAFTNFPECPNPLASPEAVYGTILSNSSGSFGNLSVKVCNSITKKGNSTCRSQVKAAVKCNEKTIDSLYDIALKQCAQMSVPADRLTCKGNAKTSRDATRLGNKTNLDTALGVCDGEFDAALQNACVNGIVM